MSIIRTSHNRDNPYVTINKGALEEPKISWEAKGLWTYLLSKPDKWQVSVKHLSSNFPSGRDKVRNILNELIQAGYCEKTNVKEKGKFVTLDYTVYESKQVKIMFPQPENPAPVLPGPSDTYQTSNEGRVSNDLREIVCSEEAPVAPPSRSTPLLGRCSKTHPDGSSFDLSIEDVFRHAVMNKTNWSAPEIEEAYKILVDYKGPIRTWERFIEGTIQNLRNAKKYAPITKKTKDKKCSQNTTHSSNTSDNEKNSSSENDMSKAQWQAFISEMGLTT